MTRLHTELTKGARLLVSFDVETTGLRIGIDRILSAAVLVYDASAERTVARHEWLICDAWRSPEQDLDSVLIHGISPAAAARSTDDHVWVLTQITQALHRYTSAGHPVVGYNLPYDLSMLISEVIDLPPAHRPDLSFLSQASYLDVRILQSKVRNDLAHARGKLAEVAPMFGIMPAHSHDAADDALVTARLGTLLLGEREDLYEMDLATLQQVQPGWYAQMNHKYSPEPWPFGAATDLLSGCQPEVDLQTWAEEMDESFRPEEVLALRQGEGAPCYDDHGMELFESGSTGYSPQALAHLGHWPEEEERQAGSDPTP